MVENKQALIKAQGKVTSEKLTLMVIIEHLIESWLYKRTAKLLFVQTVGLLILRETSQIDQKYKYKCCLNLGIEAKKCRSDGNEQGVPWE